MLLQALAACAGVTLHALATSLGVDLRGNTVQAEGDLDFRGTLAVDKQTLVGFQQVRVCVTLDTPSTREQLEAPRRLTERYCVI